MYRTCIAVVDASRARLFTFERSNEAEGVREELVERCDFVDPARRLRTGQLFSNTRSGTGRIGRLQYGLDDHRGAHVDALDAEFARMIIGELAELLRSSDMHRVIVCASPRMLGELRRLRGGLPDDVVIDEMPRDLVKLAPARLRDQLASYELLPPRQ